MVTGPDDATKRGVAEAWRRHGDTRRGGGRVMRRSPLTRATGFTGLNTVCCSIFTDQNFWFLCCH